jgi:HNH endonuclease
MKSYIPAELRRQVREDAGQRCGYCHSSEKWLGIPHEIEHIIPLGEGGATVRENLWIACRRCNAYKANRIFAPDPVSQASVQLFHPRRDRWDDHFRWSLDATRIMGITPVGRATVDALQMNHPFIVATRALWVRVGVHPA